MSTVTVNGHTYSSGGEAERDMRNGGHRSWLLPMFADAVADLADKVANAGGAMDAAVAAAALSIAAASALTATSTTSATPALGAVVVFGTQAGKTFENGSYIMAISATTPTRWIYGVVADYADTSLTLTPVRIGSAVEASDWLILGRVGAPGLDGSVDAASLVSTIGGSGALSGPMGDDLLAVVTAGELKRLSLSALAVYLGIQYVGFSGPTSSRAFTLPDQDAALGFRNVPQSSQSTNYTLIAADAGKHILHPGSDGSARSFTIPANAAVPYSIGTAVTFINQHGAGQVTISITSDTMRLVGAGTTGNRTLAANGIATAVKITATEWIISGTGLT